MELLIVIAIFFLILAIMVGARSVKPGSGKSANKDKSKSGKGKNGNAGGNFWLGIDD